MKRLLIIGAGREQVPAIKRAKAYGLTTIVTDINPHAPGADIADRFYQVSTTAVDDTLEVARLEQIDGIMTLSSETAVPVVAAVAERLQLPGISKNTARLATDKLAMKTAFLEHKVPSSPFAAITRLNQAEEFIQQHGLPAVIKPAVNSGQRGTTRIDHIEELSSAIAEANMHAPDQRILIESFVPGSEINVTAVVDNGQAHILSVSERVTAEPPHFGIAVAHSAPLDLDKAAYKHLEAVVQRATDAIGIKTGIIYPQLISSPAGPSVIEIAARIPGGYMREVALGLSGLDLIDIAIEQALGVHPNPENHWRGVRQQQAYPALVVRFLTVLDQSRIQKRPDREKLAEARALPGIMAVHWHLSASDPIPELSHSGCRFAAVIATGTSKNQAWKRAETAVSHLLE